MERPCRWALGRFPTRCCPRWKTTRYVTRGFKTRCFCSWTKTITVCLLCYRVRWSYAVERYAGINTVCCIYFVDRATNGCGPRSTYMRAGAQTLTALVWDRLVCPLRFFSCLREHSLLIVLESYWFNVFVFSVVWLHASVVGQRLAPCRFAVRRRCL